MSTAALHDSEVAAALQLLARVGLTKQQVKEITEQPEQKGPHSPMLPRRLSDLKGSGVLLLVVTDPGGRSRQVACRGGKGDALTEENRPEVMNDLRLSAEEHIAAGCRTARIYSVREAHSSRVTMLVGQYESHDGNNDEEVGL